MHAFVVEEGFIYGDIALGFIATVAAFVGYYDVSGNCKSIPRWMIAIGWTILSLRIWMALAAYGDAPIAVISVVALSMIGVGTVLLSFTRARA